MEGLDEVQYEIAGRKKVKIGLWAEKNIVLVHLREYSQQGNREIPTPKGIALTIDQWRRLVCDIEDMDEDVSEMQSAFQNNDSSFFSQGAEDVFDHNELRGGNQDAQYGLLNTRGRHQQVQNESAVHGQRRGRGGGAGYGRGGGQYGSGNRYY